MKDFEQWLSIKRGLQPITIHGYVSSIKRIAKVIGYYPEKKVLERYVYTLYNSEYSYAYKTNTVLAIERYHEFLGQPITFGRLKKPRTIIKDTLTESEITRIIFNCKTLKEKAIIALLAYSGIRNKELCNLRVRDFDAGRNTIQVISGKGLKDGISMVASECTTVLLAYTNEQKLSADDFLFKTYQGNQYTGFALRKLVKVVSRRAYIKKRVYPHLFRHSLAVNMIIRGAHIVSLKNQLRHSLMETTLHYVNSIVFGERNDYDKFVPNYI